MIRKCDEKPEVFKDVSDGFYYMESYDDNGIYAYWGFDLRFAKAAVLHLESVRFSHRILKSLMEDWIIIKAILSDVHVRDLVVTREGDLSDHKKWIKFISYFGFNDVKQQVTSIQQIGV